MASDSTEHSAPYAPVNSVLAVIRRLRDKGLPDPLTVRELQRVGVSAGNAARTLAALKFLSLVNEEGNLTSEFQRISRASTTEYPAVLAEIVHEAYSSVFTIVDPAEDSEIALNDAFRHFEPKAQRERMITLFLGLSREAELVSGGAPKTTTRRVSRPQAKKPITMTLAEVAEAENPNPDDAISEMTSAQDYRLLSALIQRLPSDGKWTSDQREKWTQAFLANVDVIIQVIDTRGGDA